LPATPWLWAYWPVMKVARDGQHSGKESTVSANVVPWAASSLRTFGIFATSVSAWSSVMTTRMFGRPSFPAVAGRACALTGSRASSAMAASVAGALAERVLFFNPPANLHSVSHSVNIRVLCRPWPRIALRSASLVNKAGRRIVAAATELVRHTSYGELSVDEVMREAGFGRTIFYRHFDDLADLLMGAAREAINELFEAHRALVEARLGDGPDVVRQTIEPAVAVFQRHGPLLRAIREAAASDEQVAAGQEAMREQFDALLAGALREMPHIVDHPPADLAETARGR